MPRNFEIKARIQSVEFAEDIAKSLNLRYDCVLHHLDTYFNIPNGRLKLREINSNASELIFYERSNAENQRVSNFEIVELANGGAMKSLLALACGIRAIVDKTRILYFYQSTRIHIDEVKGLGSFLEFEVPVNDTLEEAQGTMNYLVEKFRIHENDYFRGSYVDLIEESKT